METKILKAVFGGGRYAVTNKRTRTDYGQVLEFVGVDLPDTFECIFSNSNTSAGVGKKQIGSAQRVLIPDEYLATGQTIYAWVLVHDSEDDGRHMYNVKIPVDDMPDLSPEEPTPVEQSVISQAIAALNTAVDTTSQKASEASESADRAEQAAEGIEAYVERAEAAQSASEDARDIALEAKVSAQASAATASEKASEAISSATTASQSALTAESASESAQASADASYQNAQTAYRYAQDSATSAGQAESYAGGAGIYASDAQTHSQTASQKALEASQSAQTATQAKTDAESAKTASETAQTASESARDEAVSAKTGAESARDEAQSIANGITGKVEQIDSNTERIESLEDDRYKPYPTDTASGSVASFPDGADDIPLKSCIVQVEPVQDLHGYDSPWPAGGGKNKLNNTATTRTINGITFTVNSDGSVSCSGTATGTAVLQILQNFDYSEDMILNGCPFGGNYNNTYSMILANENGQVVSNCIDSGSGSRISASNIARVKQIQIIVRTGTNMTGKVFYPMLRLATVTDSTYTPYSNICPISGFTGCEVKHSGEDTSNPTTYPITFPSEAGTVYGAYVDVLNGELVVDMATRTLDGTEPGWNINANPNNPKRTYVYNKNASMGEILTTTEIISSYVPSAIFSGSNEVEGIYVDPAGYLYIRTAPMAGMTDIVAWTTYLSNNPLQVVYKLAEPIHYPLTSNQINSLYGQNNIWANTGDTEVEYRADVTEYINKKITEAVSALT